MEKQKQIGMLILAILMSGNALAYFPGDTFSEQNEMHITNLVYTIIGNSTIIPPLDILINLENITITLPQDMQPDSFSIVFIEEQTNTIVQTVHSHSSVSSRTKYVDRNITIEVPKYIDKIVEVPGEIKILNTETVVETTNWFQLLLVFILGIIVFMLAVLAYKKLRK